MTVEHFNNLLRGLRQLRPFQVFTVELMSGQRFEVDHADALIVRDGAAVYMAPGGVPHWFDHESVSQIIGAGTSSLSDSPDSPAA
ncbi:MAG TPA: hypothetical protein VM529_04305 [Gemmata sp.]|nr:hypothetical protein [Gemmata sp.]